MRKRLAKLTAAVAILFFLFGCAAQVKAQGQTYTIPQTVLQTFSGTCTGATQTFAIQNLGQTQHYAYMTGSGIAALIYEIDGIDSGGNIFKLSDTGTQIHGGSGLNSGTVTGSGSFPSLRIALVCTASTGGAGTFTVGYTGTSSTSNLNIGSYQVSQVDKVLAYTFSAASAFSTEINPPFSSAFGTLVFTYTPGVGPAGSTLNVLCLSAASQSIAGYTYLLSTVASAQSFVVPDTECPIISVSYTSGGASADTFSLDYVFPQVGMKLTSGYSHITGTTATVVKPGAGTVNAVVVGTPVTGTISLFDLAPAACTATPVTGVVSVLNETAANPPVSIPFGSLFLLGICAKASVASDFTVVYQ
jgi:hypothetical protein